MVPTAASTRPQLGSLAEDRALEEVAAGDGPADLDGVVLGGGVCTAMAMSWLAPSASAISWRASSRADLGQRRVRSRPRSGVTPEAPLASSITVSLVDMQPSRVHPVEGDPAGLAQLTRSAVRLDDRVGGEHHQHGGQARGEHAGALGHAADRSSPRRRRPACLATVSVVMIALAAAAPPSAAELRDQRRVDPGGILSIGSRTPISPVEQTTTSVAETPEQRLGDLLGGRVGVGEALAGRCRRWPRRS